MRWAGLVAVVAMAANVRAEDPVRILFYGDSITEGGEWVNTVDEQAGIEAINAGRSGRRAAWGKKELAPYLEKYPDLDMIFIFLGVNDLPARDKRSGEVKVAACVSNMGDVIDLALMWFEPQQIVLVAPCNVNPDAMSEINLEKGYQVTPPLLEKLEQAYRLLAQTKGTCFVSLLNVVSPENYRDGLHPNPTGDTEIAKAFLDFLSTP